MASQGSSSGGVSVSGIPENTIKIMLATDNHIGYLERDPVRGQDAINTFEEILQLAVKHEVDFLLLAGDLFHDNKPSRESLYRTYGLLRKYTMGDRPIEIELLSDPMESKPPGFNFPAVNYEDPNFNVGIPVFSIHGNHDDPQGAGADGALCALDLLSISGLLNYFGKSDLPSDDYAPAGPDGPSDGINVKPVLLRKGTTKLGLYGIGNLKDQRMHFELMNNRVKMWKPKNAQDYCNILLIHQNRVKHGPSESVPEGMFDDSIKLVVWGHEHDCRIWPEDVPGKEYRITQPGSSVATSLTEGESIQKHVALIHVEGTEYRLEPIPLLTVRPFIAEDMDLVEAAEEENVDITKQIDVMKLIHTRVEALIEKVKERWLERMESYEIDEAEYPDMLPLVRLRIDTTGVANMGNPNRIGQEYQGKIANKDPITYIQAKKRAARKIKADQPELSLDDPDLSISEKLSRIRVGTLVKEYLAAQELQLLGENGMSDAIQLFVEKDDSHSIDQYVEKALKTMLKNVQPNGDLEEAEVEDVVKELKQKHEAEYSAEKEAKRSKKESGKGKGGADDDDQRSVDSMEVDDFEPGGGDFSEEEEEPAPKKKAPAKKAAPKKAPAKTTKAKAPAKSKAKGKKLFMSDDEDEDVPEEEDEDDDDEEVAPPPKRKSRADVLSAATTKKAPQRRKAQATLDFTAGSSRGSSRTAAKNAKSKMHETIELSD